MKKGIEMSLNFLVTVIIAIVILVFGVRFISDLVVETTKLESLTTDQLDKKIENLLCETEKVCIGTTKKTIQKGKFDVFGIKIINIISDEEFSDEFNVNIRVSKLIKDNNEIIDPNKLNKIKLKYRTNNFIVEKNNEESIGIGVEVEKDAVSGTYILDVEIPQYDEIYKIYVEVP
ncbi:MAG: hypothetical protein IH934_00855 [Nanoarchaeota archaeon]|nr:hypothetical protein [Nanoarchaeota archaeon]